MNTLRLNTQHILAVRHSMLRGLILSGWRKWVAVLTIFAFVALLSTAATHHHATAEADNDCPICSAVIHKLSNPPATELPNLVVLLVSFASYLLVLPGNLPSTTAVLPPSCGPPASFSTVS